MGNGNGNPNNDEANGGELTKGLRILARMVAGAYLKDRQLAGSSGRRSGETTWVANDMRPKNMPPKPMVNHSGNRQGNLYGKRYGKPHGKE